MGNERLNNLTVLSIKHDNTQPNHDILCQTDFIPPIANFASRKASKVSIQVVLAASCFK